MTPSQVAPLLRRAITAHTCPACGNAMTANHAVAWLPDNAVALACTHCETRLVADGEAAWAVVALTNDASLTQALPATVDGLRMDTSMLSGDDHPIMTTMAATLKAHTYPLFVNRELNLREPAVRDYLTDHYDIDTPKKRNALVLALTMSATHIALCPHTSATYMEDRIGDETTYSVDISSNNVTSAALADVLRPICDWHLTESV